MASIEITGWRIGFDKIRLTKLLHTQTHLRLSEAKGYTDRILAGDTVIFDVEDDESVRHLLQEFEMIGVTVRRVETDQYATDKTSRT